MKKILSLLVLSTAILSLLCACSMIEDAQQQNATMTYINVPVDKIPDAIMKAGPKAGFGDIHKQRDDLAKGCFEGDGIKVDYIKVDDKQTKLFVRCGITGNRDKESLFIRELKIVLGLKD
ncbi:MAG: hypothetical protein A2X49_12185 [Lentisphaerae bacterium GWF2_52_8]|nr:MAG: hypothetical protein A2X49_12185 [Lentisphaerae bacterium GWF2_52_8]